MIQNEDDFLMISGIQHFEFCRRQWALIHIEQSWSENVHTVSGNIMHKKAHDATATEKRGDLIITRNMPVFSRLLGITGFCDVVEFKLDDTGVSLYGREGLWSPYPIEYKKGKSKISDADRMQLCAQAMCLEEMLLCNPINEAYLFYGETKRRECVAIDNALRTKVINAINEMRDYFTRGYTPRVKFVKICQNCSLKNLCLPKLPQVNSVKKYIDKHVKEELN